VIPSTAWKKLPNKPTKSPTDFQARLDKRHQKSSQAGSQIKAAHLGQLRQRARPSHSVRRLQMSGYGESLQHSIDLYTNIKSVWINLSSSATQKKFNRGIPGVFHDVRLRFDFWRRRYPCSGVHCIASIVVSSCVLHSPESRHTFLSWMRLNAAQEISRSDYHFTEASTPP